MSAATLQQPLPPTPPTASPPRRPSITFAVIGAGNSRSIVGFDTSVASSVTCSVNGSWECPSCCYQNADQRNLKCSMCGSKFQRGDEEEQPQDDDDWDEVGPTSNVVLVSRDSSSRSSISSGRPARRLTWKKDKSMSFGKLLANVNEGEEVTLELPMKEKPCGGSWICDACTFVNSNPLHLSCEVCGTKKPKEASASNSHASLREFFNSRAEFVGGSNSATMKEQLEALQAFEDRAVKKEQMDEIIEQQRRLMEEFSRSQGALSAVTEDETVSDGRDGYVDDETIRRTRLEMQRSSGDLLQMEQMHFAEKEEQDAMETFLNRRKAEIEQREGIVLTEHVVPKPGAQSVSGYEHQWRAQTRMLRQWRQQWLLRDEELRQIREIHQMANGSS